MASIKNDSLVDIHPLWKDYAELFSEIDKSKNKNHKMYGKPIHVLMLSPTTSKKIDWKCQKCDHEWNAVGSNRAKLERGCPACANQLVHMDGRNSIAKTHPVIALELVGDATKIIAGTSRKLNWKCSVCHHEWKASGAKRTSSGRGCPACVNQAIHVDGRNSMAQTHPNLAREYQGDAGLVIAGTHKKLDWKCNNCDHTWKAMGSDRVAGTGCPVCANREIHSDGRNSMLATHPDLAEEYQGNAGKIILGTGRLLEWKCAKCEYEWEAVGASRASGVGCPVCANKKIHPDGRNSMAKTHPVLAKEYLGDSTKIVAGTHDNLQWECRTCKHNWDATGKDRRNGNGCPVCSNHAIHTDGRNSMAKTHPLLAREYQGDATKIVAGTHQKLDWICESCSHEWTAISSNRAKGIGCPSCAKYGFQPGKPAYYYVNSIHDNNGALLYYKGGISGDWERRFNELDRGLPFSLQLKHIELKEFDKGTKALYLETILLNIKSIRIPPLDFDGGHELFNTNPLQHAREIGLLN